MSDKLIRTKRNGVYKEFNNKAWGSYYAKVEDPLADGEVDNESFTIQSNFPKLPAELWTAIVGLYFYFAKGSVGNLEAQVLLLRDEATLRKWKVIVPRQRVTGAHVDSPDFNQSIDILTGEEYTSFPPEGWVHAGSSHSHNTMKLSSFSGTDDANELTVPGAHILVSCIDLQKDTYTITSSIVMKKTRFIVESDLLINTEWQDKVIYHPKVLEYIKQELPKAYTVGAYKPPTSNIWLPKGKKASKKDESLDLKAYDYSDPFSYDANGTVADGVEEAYFATFDNEVDGLITMGVSPKDLIKRIYKIEDEQWNIMYGAY